MTDIYLDWNSDLNITPNGSIQFATGWDQIRQRIIRSLITNAAIQIPGGGTTAPDYIFDPSYGLGLGKLVDRNMTASQTQQLEQSIAQAVLEDSAVDPGSVPQVSLIANNTDLVQISIKVRLANGQGGTIILQGS